MSFDANASLYEKSRPGYPSIAMEKVFTFGKLDGSSHILEVGAGTGKATELMVGRCKKLMCVEPGEALVKMLRNKFGEYSEFEVLPISFEKYDCVPEKFDAVVAAQSAHWIDPAIRLSKTRQILKSGGTAAFLWNISPISSEPFYRSLYEIWDRLADGIREPSHSAAKPEHVTSAPGEELLQSKLFRDQAVERYPWTSFYTGTEFFNLIRTYSNHHIMEPEKKKRVLGEIESLCLGASGLIEKHYVTIVYLARV